MLILFMCAEGENLVEYDDIVCVLRENKWTECGDNACVC